MAISPNALLLAPYELHLMESMERILDCELGRQAESGAKHLQINLLTYGLLETLSSKAADELVRRYTSAGWETVLVQGHVWTFLRN